MRKKSYSTPASHSLLPKPGVCGNIKYAGVHRNAHARLGEFPWIAQIAYYILEIRELLFRCSGSLINENYVIAPGECLVYDKGNTLFQP